MKRLSVAAALVGSFSLFLNDPEYELVTAFEGIFFFSPKVERAPCLGFSIFYGTSCILRLAEYCIPS